ncbi:MAG: LCP family protein [Bacillota bacterium]|nr:LCP family protein [Bacillota bacterium]
MNKTLSLLLKTALLIILTLSLGACSQAEEEPAPELVDQPRGYLINNLISAVPGEYKRVFNSRTVTGYNPSRGEPINILLLGLDERGLSDAIIIVSYNQADSGGTIISIKRDTYIAFQTWSEPGRGHNALGWANYVGMGYGGSDYLSGAAFTADTIKRLLGINIDAYASISFDGFTKLIDEIGGVVINVPQGFAQRNNPITPGTRRLYGDEALIYARHRMNPRIPEPGSISEDGDRIRRHQVLLKAVLEQCKTLTTEELLAIYTNLNQLIHTNMDDWELLTLANLLFNLEPRHINQVVLPGELKSVYEDKIEEQIEYYYLDFEETDKILTELGLKQ